MIIGFDGSRAFTSKRTGTENYSYQLLKALGKIDKKNKYIVYLNSPEETLPDWPKNFNFKLINWSRLWTQGGLALKTFTEKLDLLFVPSHTIPLIRKPGLKTIVTVHDLGSEYLPSLHQLKQRLYLRLMQKYQLKTATKIIAVSKATKDDLVKKIGIKKEKITVIYEGFDKNLFSAKGGSSSGRKNDLLINRLRYFGIEKDKYFLFLGTVQPRKNLERIIVAFKKFAHNTDLKLAIAGQRGWMSDEIYDLPTKLGIQDKVKFLGYVPEKELPFLYSGAKALLFPSLFEGFGLPIIEAQACGCPVLTSQISSMKEIAGEAAILVNPYDVDDIVRGMGRLEQTDIKKQLIKKGLENVKNFSWERCAKETLKVLEDS